MKKICCKVCGTWFLIKREDVYRVGGRGIDGSYMFRAYDAMDCPSCGCQRILAERLLSVEEVEKERAKALKF